MYGQKRAIIEVKREGSQLREEGDLKLPTFRCGLCVRGCSAFTLIDLMSALAIMAILTAGSLVLAKGFLESGRKRQAKAELSMIQHALEAYRAKFGDYPREASEYTGDTSSSGDPVDTGAITQKEHLLFNALSGKLDPSLNPVAVHSMLDLSSLSLETTKYPNPTVTVPSKSDWVANRILDPWGNPYLYYYKSPSLSGWTNFSYVLYSEGPDEKSTTIDSAGYGTPSLAYNEDNLYAE